MIAYITTYKLNIKSYSISTIATELVSRGIKVRFFDISSDDIRLNPTPNLIYVCHPMLSSMIPLYREMENRGCVVLSDIESSLIASDKWLSYKSLISSNIRTPVTQLIRQNEIPNVGWPCVIKPTCRWFGEGASLVFSSNDVHAAYIKASSYHENQVIAQEYLGYMHNLVIVANTIGDNIFSSYMSIGRGGFMSAIDEKQRAVIPMAPPDDIIDITKRVIKSIPIDISRMEMMLTEHGPSIIDINSGGARMWVDVCSKKNSARYLADHLISKYEKCNVRNYS
jgi:glutathione synthase/RimK-type ligase-like ATP-grasp enzyme